MRSYLVKMLAVIGIVCAAVAAFNMTVDPFGLWELRRVEGINRYKPNFTDGMRAAKPHVVRIRKPTVVLLGSSRVGEGLSCSMLEDEACYNGAFPGGTLYEALRLLQHMQGVPTRVYLGLDFEAVLQPQIPAGDFSENRFRYTAKQQFNLRYPWQSLRDYFSLVFAVDTGLKSLRTVAGQTMGPAEALQRNLQPDGGWNIRRRSSDTDSRVAVQAQAGAYRLIYNYTRAIATSQMKVSPADLERQHDEYFDLLEQIIALAIAENIQLQLFVNPSHALNLQAFAKAGAETVYLEWLRRLQLLAQTHAGQLPDIVDFSGYTPVTLSPLPSAELNPYFNDPVHYSHLLGGLMVEQMRAGCSIGAVNAGGRCLKSVQLASYSQQFLRQSSAYAEQLSAQGFLR